MTTYVNLTFFFFDTLCSMYNVLFCTRREMAVKDIEVNNEKSNGVLLSSSDKWNRLWPEVPESDSDAGYSSGDPSDGCC